ncbi:MAG TPA: hypothetical protein VF913_14805 [Xanthobacteraceae bacterium]
MIKRTPQATDDDDLPRNLDFEALEREDPKERHRLILHAAKNMIRKNPDVRSAFKAIRGRGVPHDEAEAEIARAFLGCYWETARGLPNRWPSVLSALRKGKTTSELFPDELYETTPQDKPS